MSFTHYIEKEGTINPFTEESMNPDIIKEEKEPEMEKVKEQKGTSGEISYVTWFWW